MKYVLIKIAIFLLKFVYFFMKLFRTQNKITLISRQSNNISIDFALIRKEIEKNNKYKTVVLCQKLEGKENAKFLSLCKYGIHMIIQMYHIATSKIIILDSYCICISVLKHKKNLKVIQIWHSIGTMKKFGYDILGLEEGNDSKLVKILKMHNNYDVVLCAGEGYIDDLSRGFNCDRSIIKVISLPRTDLLKDKKYILKIKDMIYDKYPEVKNKKNIVYVPTFRKNEVVFQKILDNMISMIDFEKYNFIIKLHPLSKVVISSDKVYTINEFSSMETLMIADHVITDYSCILYEAGVLNKPLYFYCFDYDEYNKSRSLNIDYFNELPGLISKDFKKIIKYIDNEKYDYNKLKRFVNKYVTATGDSAKKIYDLILELDK